MIEKKKHHFIAQTYLRGFGNQHGKVCVYSKDKPAEPWWAAPETVAFEKYYYSQPTPDGGQDNNRLEDFFCSIETGWPELVSKINRREPHHGWLDQLLVFALMHRVRVPTVRDAVEKMLAELVRMFSRHLNDLGETPPPSPGYTFEFLDKNLAISIDPHRSIHAMADFAKGVTEIISAVGFRIVENKTAEGFITSDNPVVYFDPTVPQNLMQPYTISRDRMDIDVSDNSEAYVVGTLAAKADVRPSCCAPSRIDRQTVCQTCERMRGTLRQSNDFFQRVASSITNRKVCG